MLLLFQGNGTRARRIECGRGEDDDVEEAIARMAMREFSRQQQRVTAAAAGGGVGNVRSNL